MPDPITPAERAELRRLHEAATQPPWHYADGWSRVDAPYDADVLRTPVICLGRHYRDDPVNLALTAAARNALPALLDAADERDALAARLAEVERIPTGGIELAREELVCARLIDWILETPRRPANSAFTSGAMRQVAYRIEDALRDALAGH